MRRCCAARVYLLILPDGDRDLPGITAGLTAAACWASYILLNRTVGRRLAGLQATAIAATFAVTMSLNPLFAATAGVLVLDEAIDVHEWVGIVVIVLVNAVAATPHRWSGQANEPAPASRLRTAVVAGDCQSTLVTAVGLRGKR